jgi:hypothetical protein
MVKQIGYSLEMGLARSMDEWSFTIVVLGVDGEGEVGDEEVTDVGAALAGGEVQGGALVGVLDGSSDGGDALALLVERRSELCNGA